MNESEFSMKPEAESEDLSLEQTLRPTTLSDFVGQQRVKDQIDLLLRAARERKSPADHILLSGPPGLGKTTLAMIVASEMNAPIRITSGPAIQHAGDLASILSSLVEGEILFLDEIHRMARPAEEMLYMAMEDFRVDVIVGKGPGATAIPLRLPHFTLVGATTRAGLLPAPLRDRFGFTAHLDFYDDADLTKILKRSADLLTLQIAESAISEIGKRSRGTPRIANRLLRRVRDFAQVHGNGSVNLADTNAALTIYEVDHIGLDRLDKAVITALVERFNGGPDSPPQLRSIRQSVHSGDPVTSDHSAVPTQLVRSTRSRSAFQRVQQAGRSLPLASRWSLRRAT